jgi:hypothetical protein
MTPETKESINRFLTEWTGDKWKEPFCEFQVMPNYFTPEGFFQIWNKAKESEGWEDFLADNGRIDIIHSFMNQAKVWMMRVDLIDPQVFPYEQARFLGWKEKK